MLINCKQCEREFKPARHWQEFCTSDCRNAYHNGLAKQDRRNGAKSEPDLLGKLGIAPVVGDVRRL